MAPFYVPSGILLNGNQTDSIEFMGNGVNVSGANVAIPGVVYTKGGVTVTSPVSTILAGTATLSENAIDPSVVQVNLNGNIPNNSLPANPSAGNLLLFFYSGSNQLATLSGFTTLYNVQCTGSTWQSCFAKISQGTEKTVSFTAPGGDLGTSYFEIDNFNSIGTISASGQAPAIANPVVTNAQTIQTGLTLVHIYSRETSGNFSGPVPSGATLIGTINNGNNSAFALLSYNGNGTSEQIGATLSTSVNGDTSYGIATVLPNPANISAVITT